MNGNTFAAVKRRLAALDINDTELLIEIVKMERWRNLQTDTMHADPKVLASLKEYFQKVEELEAILAVSSS